MSYNLKKNLTTSKYRHSVGKQAKKENSYYDLAITSSASEASNSIATSKKWIAYKHSGPGGYLSLLKLNSTGKQSKSPALIATNSMDFEFSPFNDDLLLSGGDNGSVSLWDVSNFTEALNNPSVSINGFSKRVDSVGFHPTADRLVAASGANCLKLFDLSAEKEVLGLEHSDHIYSFSWCRSNGGSLLASSCKDSAVRVFDPRNNNGAKESMKLQLSASKKSSRVLFVSEDRLLVTFVNQIRQKEMAFYDTKNLSSPLQRIQFDSNSSQLVPLFDYDTSLVYLYSKGESSLKFFELSPTGEPHFIDGQNMMLNGPISGATLVNKRNLNVMEAEINRLLCISNDTIVPVSYQVPRKSYRDFHEDLFPLVDDDHTELTSSQWLEGKNYQLKKLSLDPSKGNLVSSDSHEKTDTQMTISEAPKQETSVKQPTSVAPAKSEKSPSELAPPQAQPERKISNKTAAVLAGIRTSSYRYLQGKPLHQSQHFEDVRNLNYQVSGESNFLEGNKKFLIFPQSGSGGRVTVLEADKTRRVGLNVPTITSGSELCDMAITNFAPFELLVTATEDGKIRGFNANTVTANPSVHQEPAFSFNAHNNRINLCRFHPYVDGLLLTSATEQGSQQAGCIKIWDLSSSTEKARFEVPDAVFGVDFDRDGGEFLLGVASKDRQIRIMDIRKGSAVLSTQSHEGLRGCRIVYADSNYLVSTGFNKSQREMFLFDKRQFSEPLFKLSLDISPSPAVPHYDEDSKLIYLCGKGDTFILPIEVTSNDLFPLPKYDAPGGSIQQGVKFVNRKHLNAKDLEVARCFRLTQNSIENISFSVPRQRREYFQDDLFPLCRDYEHPSMSASEYFTARTEVLPKKDLDLCPASMTKLSAAPADVKAPPKYSYNAQDLQMSDNDRKKKFLNEIFQNAKEDDEVGPLKQDMMEGVEDHEWDD